MEVVPVIAYLLAIVTAIIAIPLSIYNFFMMMRETKPNAGWWINLIPYLAFALPGSLTPVGEAYRGRATRWLMLAAIAAAVAAGAQALFVR